MIPWNGCGAGRCALEGLQGSHLVRCGAIWCGAKTHALQHEAGQIVMKNHRGRRMKLRLVPCGKNPISACFLPRLVSSRHGSCDRGVFFLYRTGRCRRVSGAAAAPWWVGDEGRPLGCRNAVVAAHYGAGTDFTARYVKDEPLLGRSGGGRKRKLRGGGAAGSAACDTAGGRRRAGSGSRRLTQYWEDRTRGFSHMGLYDDTNVLRWAADVREPAQIELGSCSRELHGCAKLCGFDLVLASTSHRAPTA